MYEYDLSITNHELFMYSDWHVIIIIIIIIIIIMHYYSITMSSYDFTTQSIHLLNRSTETHVLGLVKIFL